VVAAHLVRHSRHALDTDSDGALRGIPCLAVCLVRIESVQINPLLWLSRPQGLSCCRAPSLRAPLMSFGSSPFSAIRSSGYCSRFHPRLPPTSPVSHRPREHPFRMTHFRVYFAPIALLGFSLQGFPLLRRLRCSSQRTAPPVVAMAATRPYVRRPRNACTKAWLNFRGLTIRSSPFAEPGLLRHKPWPLPSWVSPSLGNYRTTTMRSVSLRPPMRFGQRGLPAGSPLR
jgi:hypothetical protein